jgi:hypothetical protein
MAIWENIRKADTHLQQVLFRNTDRQVAATMDPDFAAGPGKAGDVEHGPTHGHLQAVADLFVENGGWDASEGIGRASLAGQRSSRCSRSSPRRRSSFTS